MSNLVDIVASVEFNSGGKDCAPPTQHDCQPPAQHECPPPAQHDCPPPAQHECPMTCGGDSYSQTDSHSLFG